MRKSIKDLELDLKNFKPINSDDKFVQIMTTFLVEAKDKFQLLEQMFAKMERLFQEIARYYAFDPKKYTMDEFFNDIKSFKDQFIEAKNENIKKREMEDKLRRAQKAKEKAEKEKLERKSKCVNLDIAKEQEGVMDSLLEALQTGSAFPQPKRKRQQRAINPNGMTTDLLFLLLLNSCLCRSKTSPESVAISKFFGKHTPFQYSQFKEK